MKRGLVMTDDTAKVELGMRFSQLIIFFIILPLRRPLS
jgi:hypothetical protein